jgi:hypothetical protein
MERMTTNNGLASLAASLMYNAISRRHDMQEIKSETLTDALNTLHKIYMDNGWGLDLHGKNFMVRKGASGFQIVITDPFS